MAILAIFSWRPQVAGAEAAIQAAGEEPLLGIMPLDRRMPVLSQSLGDRRSLALRPPSVFTKNIASCDFFLAGLRPLVLTRPSGPDG